MPKAQHLGSLVVLEAADLLFAICINVTKCLRSERTSSDQKLSKNPLTKTSPVHSQHVLVHGHICHPRTPAAKTENRASCSSTLPWRHSSCSRTGTGAMARVVCDPRPKSRKNGLARNLNWGAICGHLKNMEVRVPQPFWKVFTI